MKGYLGEVFEAVISGVSSFGFWAETVAHKCEGLVSVAGLSDYDDFRHNESDYSLDGLRSGRRFRMGDRVQIRVVAANLEKRQLDYEWVLRPDEEGAGEGRAVIAAAAAKNAVNKKAPKKAPAKKRTQSSTVKKPKTDYKKPGTQLTDEADPTLEI
jgi:ribonuclease R